MVLLKEENSRKLFLHRNFNDAPQRTPVPAGQLHSLSAKSGDRLEQVVYSQRKVAGFPSCKRNPPAFAPQTRWETVRCFFCSI